MTRLSPLAFVALAAFGCSARSGQTPGVPRELPGPTSLSRSAAGYVLANRHVRVVVDGRTGDVVSWGRVGGSPARVSAGLWGWAGRLGRDGVLASNVTDAHAEQRDEQTWQFIGTDAVHNIGWRKIYVLEGDAVFASYLVQNLRTDGSITCGVLLTTDPPTVAQQIHAFNDTQNLSPPVGLSGAVAGDVKTLKPGERLDLTTTWQTE